jgi:hypothetical protein
LCKSQSLNLQVIKLNFYKNKLYFIGLVSENFSRGLIDNISFMVKKTSCRYGENHLKWNNFRIGVLLRLSIWKMAPPSQTSFCRNCVSGPLNC